MTAASAFNDEPNRMFPTLFWGVLAAAFTLRAGIAYYYDGASWYVTDSHFYFEQARAILDGGWKDRWPNGYPLLIAVCLTLFGDSADVALIALNVAMSTAIVALVFLLARERTQNMYAVLLAALVAAAWPTHLSYVRFLASEVPATFFLCFGIFMMCRNRDLGGGLALGMASIIRPTLTPVAVLLAGLLLFRRQYARAAILLAASLAMPIGLLAYSNSVTGDSEPSVGLARAIMQGRTNIDEQLASFEYQGETTSEALTILAQDLIDDPIAFAGLRLEKMWDMWGPWPHRLKGRGDKGPRHWFWNILLGVHFPLLVLALIGLWKRPDFDGFVLFVPAFVLTGIHGLIHGLPRYAMPAEPMLIVLASSLAVTVWTSLRRRHPAAQPEPRDL